MTPEVRVSVPGKVNLALKVGPVRPDGYHPLATVFQAVSIHDEITVRPARAGRFTVDVTGEQAALVPRDDTNLAVRAARLVASTHGSGRLGCHIAIRKSIPVTGGMAGGSADAAGALLACSVLWDLDLDLDDLTVLGGSLGADVPFGLLGHNALGTGRGDVLVPALSRGTYHWVLALADYELSTPATFRRFDELTPDPRRPEVPRAVLEALAAGDAAALGRALVNDLEAAAVSLRPQLAQVLEAGRDLGAWGALVSGSGPTVAFLASSESAAIDLSVRLSGLGLCRSVRRVAGPVPGARLLSPA